MLLWAWLFTLPGLLLTALGVGEKPGRGEPGRPAGHADRGARRAGDWRPRRVARSTNWLPFLPDGAFALRVDPLAALMLAVVGGVSLCVYVYSLGYMDGRSAAGIRRFFVFLDFFVASMALLVLAGNIAVLLSAGPAWASPASC